MKEDMKTAQAMALAKKGKFQGTAITCGGRTISYEEFDRVTDAAAFLLSKTGARPGRRVMIRLKRTERFPLALFGVIKTGAAFIPLKEDTPKARIELIKKSSEAVSVIDEMEMDKLLRLSENITEEELAAWSPDPAAPEDDGMIIFTSGSTGEPKGVVQTQSALAFLFEQFPDNIDELGFSIPSFEKVIARLNESYIVSYHFEYGIALMSGRQLILADEEQENSVPELSRLVKENRGCFFAMLPSQLGVFLADERFRNCLPDISCIAVFGEPIASETREKLTDNPDYRGAFVSLYGQSEIGGIAWMNLRENPPVMKKGPAVSALLTDGDSILPAGERGELCVTSPTVFKNYLLSDMDTARSLYEAKTFFKDGIKYVRSGDVGTIEADGRFILSGRADRMVKFHGQRIELPEVENTLMSYPDVLKAAVVVGKNRLGKSMLAAYMETKDEKCIPAELLNRHMAKMLPAYMIPSVYVTLKSLPVTSTGKIDFKTLTSQTVEVEEKAAGEEKRNTEEKILIEKIAQLVKMNAGEISLADNLTALGIDSLEVVLLVDALEDKGYSFGVQDFLQAPTVRELAARLKKKEKADSVQEEAVRAEYPLTDMQTFWHSHKLKVLGSFAVKKIFDEAEFAGRVKKLGQNHPALRSDFGTVGDKTIFKISSEGKTGSLYYDLTGLSENSAAVSDEQRKFIIDHMFGFYAGRPESELFFAAYFKLSAEGAVIVTACDHRVIDGMSEKILLNELLTDGQGEKDLYIDCINRISEADYQKAGEEFYAGYLKGAVPGCLPVNKKYTGHERMKTYSIRLSREKSEEIEAYCREQLLSVPAAVMYCYGQAVMDIIGENDILFEAGLSGRQLPVSGMSRVVGCLVNAVPIRIKRTDTILEFMKGYLESDEYSALPVERIYKAAFGHKMKPLIAPFIVSHIFPSDLLPADCKPFRKVNYASMPRTNFLWLDEGCICICFHMDIDLWEENAVSELVEKMKFYLETLVSSCR